jgi:uncharacterized membrane protein YheB (UPF0754 family)
LSRNKKNRFLKDKNCEISLEQKFEQNFEKNLEQNFEQNVEQIFEQKFEQKFVRKIRTKIAKTLSNKKFKRIRIWSTSSCLLKNTRHTYVETANLVHMYIR